MKKKLFFIGCPVFLLLACTSTADEPQADYNLLNFLGIDAVENLLWTGRTVQSQCLNSEDTAVCTALKVADDSFVGNNIVIFFSNPVLLHGDLTVSMAHPDRLEQNEFPFSVQGDMKPGYETGNGLSRILTLSSRGTNPVASNGVQASLDQFRADVLEEGLQGTITLSYPGTSLTSVVYSFNMKSVR